MQTSSFSRSSSLGHHCHKQPTQRHGYSHRQTCADVSLHYRSLVSSSASAQIESRAYDGVLSVSRVVQRYSSVDDAKEKARMLLAAGRQLPDFPDSEKTAVNRVMGCTSQVWVSARLESTGCVQFSGTSDSELSRGLCAVLVEALSGLKPEEVLQVDDSMLQDLALGSALLQPSRANGFSNMLETMRRRARALLLPGSPNTVQLFPSLRITASELTPQGVFAEAQAQYLAPDQKQVDKLVDVLSSKKMGVVAHFYMDPEVQGVLMSAAERWPHIYISDSLVMADTAVKMAKEGCRYIAVLGVDFMSENVRAILDEAGYSDVAVYRMSPDTISCSLAVAAESKSYIRYLEEASATPNSLHVVYINTSLVTKATADSLVPTITCTSSNVVQTVLQAFHQVPEATVWYGPDTYMGRNLAQLFTSLSTMPDEEVKAIHPHHSASSVKDLLPRLKYFEDGTCIVHHIFGGEVCEQVRLFYGDAYLAAHFEVPGEMFTLAMQAKRRGMGVVGSTSNILDFIANKVQEALSRPHGDVLKFVLGTEAGMVTSIVRKIQGMLAHAARHDIEVEIVFPVASKSISTAQQQPSTSDQAPLLLPGGLAVLPGPASGEGCSLEGGCAACPYMRMNTLDALLSVADKVGSGAGESLLTAFKPKPYSDLIKGKTVAQAGCVPILHMRHFQKNKGLSEDLVQDIKTRHA
ncbi:hypothetical protein CEUSTIGMA_g1003.t1 [Chlamydomonas eustigma]|uniref:Quinolinate synthase, chloroplastic n=1 Tax=Chlamydomonas eustigma TaxID=1157962 RepID=A0A250WS97_9CHLO|nr:hypothetical protein CEUSTIGMA_g1003.t1 [Chlamydomonas eustigma]|eukprot:GAX73552.1 hypothetical protein CEUSTIGMA_g1003.t1 [Chlamydomonas eustigma]